MTCAVYLIGHIPTGRSYIGASTNVERRWTQHRSLLNGGKHTSRPMQEAWSQDGALSFKWEILSECQPSELKEREHGYQELYAPAFNTTPEKGRGGSRAGAGRTPFLDKSVKLCISISSDEATWLRQLGNGNISKGVREACRLSKLPIDT